MFNTIHGRHSRPLAAIMLLAVAAICINATYAQGELQPRTAEGSTPRQAAPPHDTATQTSVDDVIAALIEATKSDNEDVQVSAYAGLGSFLNDKQELVEFFVDAAESTTGRVQSTVVRSMTSIESTPSREVIAAVIEHGLSPDSSSSLRTAAIAFLRNHHEVCIPMIIDQLQLDSETSYRVGLVRQLRNMAEHSAAAVQPMLTILADEKEPPELRARVAIAVAVISKAHADTTVAAAELSDPAREQAKQMDTNGDGKVDVTELPVRGGDSQFFFSRMDADGDGFVSLDELMKVMGGTGR